MAIADTAQLAVLLRLTDEMSPALAQAEGSLNRFGTSASTSASKLSTVSKVTTSAGQALTHFGGVVGGVVKSVGLLGATTALFAGPAAIGAAVKGAVDFQQQMELIRTQAGASQAEVDNMSKALLQMGNTTAYSANELALGLYHIESVGYRGATALNVLTAAAQGARLGSADLESTSTALVAAVYSGIKGVENLTTAMGSLDAIVGSGNMRMEDLVQALGTGILASARAVGLSLNDVGAALAVLVDQGVPAVTAATRLRTTLGLIAAPSKAAQNELKSVGVTGNELANDMRKPNGLITVLTDLHDKLQKAGDIGKNGELTSAGAAVVYRAFGASRSGTTMVTLLDSMSKVQSKYGQITQNAADFGARVDATTQTAAYHFAQFQSAISDLGTALGVVLLPFASEFASSAAKWLTDNQTGIVVALEDAGHGAEVLATALGTVFSILKQIHDLPLAGTALDLLAGGAVAGKISSLLFGKNPFTWALGAVAGRLGGLLGLGGSSGAKVLGSINPALATPVYVVNMPLGGLGSGLGSGATATEGIASDAADAGGALSLATLGTVIGAWVGSIGGAIAIANIIKTVSGTTDQQQQYQQTHGQFGRRSADSAPTPTKTYTGPTDLAALAALAPLRQMVAELESIANAGKVNADQADKVTQELLWHSKGGSVQTLQGAIQRLSAEQKQATKEGNTQAAQRIGLDIHQLQQRLTQVESARGQMLQGAIQTIGGIFQAGFGGMIAAIQGIQLPAYFGTAAQQGRGTGPAGRPKVGTTPRVGIEQNRPQYAVTMNVNVSSTARSNSAASTTQHRYGPSAVTAGAAVVLP